jgi:hypothetical protein
LKFSLLEATSHIELGLTLMTSLYHGYLWKDPHLQIRTHPKVMGFRTPMYGFGATQFNPYKGDSFIKL